jgi:molybdopterin-biosynthesis enzyme MoeA-like protein
MKIDTETYNYIEKQLSKRNPAIKMTKNHARMATFPHPAKLLRERDDLKIPIVVVNDNIFILPGIPSLFKTTLGYLVPQLEKSSGSKFYRNEIATQQSEVTIADTLTATQVKADKFGIKIGSYPVWGKNAENIRVVVTVSGKDQAQVDDFSREVTREIQGWPYINKSRL